MRPCLQPIPSHLIDGLYISTRHYQRSLRIKKVYQELNVCFILLSSCLRVGFVSDDQPALH
jgi:hypothetical protein